MSKKTDTKIESSDSITESYDELMKQYQTKSNMIRYLYSIGHSKGDISRFMNIRYQHVRNVLLNPIKKK